MSEKILEIKDLFVQYSAGKDIVRAVNGISLTLEEGESLGLVGETGAGKSIIIDAVSFVLGERADRSLIRYGTDYACRFQAGEIQPLFDRL